MADEIRASIKVDADVAAAEKNIADLNNRFVELATTLGEVVKQSGYETESIDDLVKTMSLINIQSGGKYTKLIDEFKAVRAEVDRVAAALKNEQEQAVKTKEAVADVNNTQEQQASHAVADSVTDALKNTEKQAIKTKEAIEDVGNTKVNPAVADNITNNFIARYKNNSSIADSDMLGLFEYLEKVINEKIPELKTTLSAVTDDTTGHIARFQQEVLSSATTKRFLGGYSEDALNELISKYKEAEKALDEAKGSVNRISQEMFGKDASSSIETINSDISDLLLKLEALYEKDKSPVIMAYIAALGRLREEAKESSDAISNIKAKTAESADAIKAFVDTIGSSFNGDTEYSEWVINASDRMVSNVQERLNTIKNTIPPDLFDSLSDQLDKIKTDIDKTKADIDSKLHPDPTALYKDVEKINDIMQRLERQGNDITVLHNLTDETQLYGDELTAVTSGALTVFENKLQEISDELNKQADELSNNGSISTDVITKINSGAKELSGILSNFADIIPEDVFIVLYKKYEEINKEIQTFSENARTANSKVLNAFREQSQKVSDELDKQAEKLKNNGSISRDTINKLTSDVAKLSTILKNNKDIIPDDEYKEELKNIDELKDKLKALKQEYASSGNNTTLSKLNGIKSEIGAFAGEVAIPIAIIKKTWDLFNESLEDTIDIASNIGSAIVSGIGIATKAISELVDLAEQAAMKLKDLADSGVDIQQGWFTLYNYLGSDGGTIIKDFATKLQDVYGIDADPLIGQMRGILGVVSNMNLELDKATDMTKALVMFGLDASKFSGESFENVVGQLESAISLGTLNTRSPIVRALDMTKEDVKKFRELGTVQERANFILSKGEKVRGLYAKWLNTSAGRVEQLNQSLSRLQGAIQKLSTGVLGVFALQIKRCVDGLSQFIEMIAEVLNITVDTADLNFAGDFTPGNGIALTADEYGNLADSVTKAGKAYKEATPQAASFDDVIQLSDNIDTGDSLDDTVDSLKDLDIGDSLFNFENATTELTDFQKRVKDFVAELKDLISAGDFYGVGARLNEFLTDELKQINWDDIQNTVVEKIQGITSFINGFFGNKELFQEVGNFFAELINTFNLGVTKFFSNIRWDNVGKDIAASWVSFWQKFDAAQLGQALASVISSAFTLATGFVQEMLETGEDGLNGFQEIGFKISEVINNFFASFSEEDFSGMADTIASLIDGVFQGIGAFMDNLDTTDILLKVKEFVGRLVTNLVEKAPEWGEQVGKVVDFIIDLIDTTIDDPAKVIAVSNAISTFIDKAHIGELVWKIMSVELLHLAAKIRTKIKTFFDGLVDTVQERIGDILDVGDAILTWLGVLFGKILDKVMGLFGDWGEGFSKFFGNLAHGIASAFKSIINGISDVLAKVLKLDLTGAWDALKSIPGKALDSFKGWLSDTWNNYMATGGVVDRPTRAIIGEAGREVVLPLENNTGWMDILSAKIAVQVPQLANNGILKALQDNKGIINNNTNIDPFNVNNGGWMDRLASKIGDNVNANRASNSPIVIDTSQLNKMVYSRDEMVEMGGLIAEALNAYGVAVSVV